MATANSVANLDSKPASEPESTTKDCDQAGQANSGDRSLSPGKESARERSFSKIKNKVKPPGGFDPTPLPDAPPGYTVRIVFHKATNLPVADLHSNAADPYIVATLTHAAPRRHKEEPDLTHRTPTVRRSTEPVWENEWIVANVPESGFTLKCRLYDEDWPDHDDRLGNVTIRIPYINEQWQGLGPDGQLLDVKKRAGSKRAYLFKGVQSVLSKKVSMTAKLQVSIDVMCMSDPPHAQVYTLGPTTWTRHFSPMIGRLAGIKVNKQEEDDAEAAGSPGDTQVKKYDFQANELQLGGPVPPKLYHRFVEFRPIIGLIFAQRGISGRLLSKALHKQHCRIYNYDSSTQHGQLEACSEEASLQFLKMAHFDEGGRSFTYVLTLDGLLRFTETGHEFGIDLLSKHSMHSDGSTYIACSGEFFIQPLARANGSDEAESEEAEEPTHRSDDAAGEPAGEKPRQNPRHYRLIIDNDSGTYRPDKSVLPDLKAFLERNFPGLDIVAMHWEDASLQRMKERQRDVKKKEGPRVKMVLNRSPSNSSMSSDDRSRLGDLERADGPMLSKKERAFDALQDPHKAKEMVKDAMHLGRSGK